MTDGDAFKGVAGELGRARLGDPRRSRRLGQVVDKLRAFPAASFPVAMGSAGQLEALYRFVNNPAVTMEQILQPHFEATVERAGAAERVLVLHDTTYFTFQGEREGLGRINSSDHGFWGHFSLAVHRWSSDGRRPLGLMAVETGTRHGPSRWKGKVRCAPVDDNNKETYRWSRAVDLVEQRLQGLSHHQVVHVMDREADNYELLAPMVAAGHRFVVRLSYDRRLATEQVAYVSDALEGRPLLAERQVELGARVPDPKASNRQRKRHPPRPGRRAHLEIRAERVQLRRSEHLSRKLPASIALQVVQVQEVHPPEGQPPVDWMLLTTEPVDTPEQVEQIVDDYRARWLIEEYFKALKTGCAFEKRQLTSKHALHNALGLLAPIAYELLVLRDTARREPDAPASAVLSPQLQQLLAALVHRPLPEPATAADILYAIASLGGHLKRNGPPGWMTLGRGYQKLLDAFQGWQAAQRAASTSPPEM